MAVKVVTALQYSMTGVSAMAAIENLLAIAVFAGTKKLRIKYYTFVVNLALADLNYALFTMALHWSPGPSGVLEGFIVGAYTVSILTILAVAINRYLALSLMPPARYDSLITGYRLIGVCIIFWCLGPMYGLVIYNAVPGEVFFVVHFLGYPLAGVIVWVITALVYFLVFRKIKHYTPPLASAAGISANEERDQTRVQQTHRLLVMFVLILVVSFTTWVPAFVLNLCLFFNTYLWSDEIFLGLLWGSYLLYTLSTAINPLIYLWRLDGFREGFYAMFCRCVKKAEPNQIEADLTTNENTLAETGL
ncbi:adenosine receptor A2b-like [Patiria miniata]|uniref:G-protein coupled receptors family 1 profile domain-containing protein n=1 Tax=Patiria miniata TaxID=46514 RepID=A0A914AQY8_PATMI|nr:adenosine receptor A2b-like [Patiria miniata]XP_038066183.1 adenosine receptor A2b-like [Patiria miniata]XP_038066184.1 adenosine receptor A2b-like [Patiria miniata]